MFISSNDYNNFQSIVFLTQRYLQNAQTYQQRPALAGTYGQGGMAGRRVQSAVTRAEHRPSAAQDAMARQQTDLHSNSLRNVTNSRYVKEMEIHNNFYHSIFDKRVF